MPPQFLSRLLYFVATGVLVYLVDQFIVSHLLVDLAEQGRLAERLMNAGIRIECAIFMAVLTSAVFELLHRHTEVTGGNPGSESRERILARVIVAGFLVPMAGSVALLWGVAEAMTRYPVLS